VNDPTSGIMLPIRLLFWSRLHPAFEIAYLQPLFISRVCHFKSGYKAFELRARKVNKVMDDHNIPVLKSAKPRKNGSRKLVYLVIGLFMTVLIILFFRSSISKVAQITITGNQLVPQAAIGQAARISVGDSYFSVSSSSIEQRVKSLKMIDSVKVTKKFPGLVHIDVKEYPRVAFALDADGVMEALLADGSKVSLKGLSIPMDKPLLTNWKDDDPLKAKLCGVLAQIPSALLSDISEIKPNPSAAYEDKIKIYTRSQFEVNTTVGFLLEKIPYLSSMINDMKEKNNISSGVLTLLESAYGEQIDKNSKNTDSTTTPAPTVKATPRPTPKPTPKPTVKTTPKPA
jgi:cell division protein FtsQ